MEQYNCDNINELIKRTGKLIDSNPLLGATGEIDSIKKNFDAIHEAINNENIGEDEKQGLFSKMISGLIGKDKEFQYRSFEGKIESIFTQFDLTSDSIGNTIEMYEEYGEGLAEENKSLQKFIDGVKEEELDNKEKGRYNNYLVMLNTLKLSLGRINMSLDSAKELYDTMGVTRPIFQATLSSCLVEVAGQKTIDASVQMLGTLSGTVEQLSNKLTEATIKTSTIALEVSSKPILTSGNIEKNMLLLKSNFDSLEERKNQLLLNQ